MASLTSSYGYQNGTTLQGLQDVDGVARSLVALNVSTQPYTWGRTNAGTGQGTEFAWNTSAYTTGTYYVTIQSRLNNM